MSKLRTISDKTKENLDETFRRVLGTLPPQGAQPTANNGRAIWYWAKLTSALAAPSNGMTSPTTATFDLWVPDGVSTPPGVTLVRSTDTSQQGLTVYNRFTGLSASSGTIIQVEYAWGEWTLKGSDC
ncbi:MAG: hypothetical protein E6Q40_00910 [Cupriavidus sp.]|nr:MAG: hypothetical protein E6Q40_00910 [Cupriavidus sp.]